MLIARNHKRKLLIFASDIKFFIVYLDQKQT